MVQRVMPDLMGLKNILVLNDEAHHCYREKPDHEDEGELQAEEKKEAEKNSEAARLWISGLEIVKRKVGLSRVIDLSATPFFLRGSGYAEGTLFPWTMSDFSLMDAIESGIVKLPRVPVADNIPGSDMPRFRNLWEHIRSKMPKKGRGKAKTLDPLEPAARPPDGPGGPLRPLPEDIRALAEGRHPRPALLHRGLQQHVHVEARLRLRLRLLPRERGWHRATLENGRLALFRNFDEHGNPIARPNTLLIDSEQLESGEALEDNFRAMASDEIERFRREIVERTGDQRQAENLTDTDLLREVMNTVGKRGRLGEQIRCVVSVSMLTEGWDANTVTHVLGVRAFGTQLLCEQVIGRALRRQSYELNEGGLLNVEYADVLGIPFDFTAKPVVAPPQPPKETVQVHAVRPDRDALEIRFPRVEGYRVELPEERLTAKFTPDSVLELTPDIVGPSITRNAGIIGEGVDLNLKHLEDMRRSTLLFHLAKRLLYTKWRDPGEEPKLYLFDQLKRITKEWLDTYLVCKGGTYPAQLMYQELADMACERITAAITQSMVGERPIKVVLDPYNPTGSTAHVNFTTSKTDRWETAANRCHVNWVVLDSDWEAEFCRVVEAHPQVRAYVKNHSLGLDVPYRYGSEVRTYRPDFIVLVDDGHGDEDPLHLIVEIKGYRREDAKDKKNTMDAYWVPGVNNLRTHGRWAFAELTEIYQIEADLRSRLMTLLDTAAWTTGSSGLPLKGGSRERSRSYLLAQFGDARRWGTVHSAIWDELEAHGLLRLADLDRLADTAGASADDILTGLALLAAPSVGCLSLRMTERSGRDVAPSEFSRRLREWWSTKVLSEREWMEWAEAVDVLWTPAPASAGAP